MWDRSSKKHAVQWQKLSLSPKAWVGEGSWLYMLWYKHEALPLALLCGEWQKNRLYSIIFCLNDLVLSCNEILWKKWNVIRSAGDDDTNQKIIIVGLAYRFDVSSFSKFHLKTCSRRWVTLVLENLNQDWLLTSYCYTLILEN
jgi:hypothetical protein